MATSSTPEQERGGLGGTPRLARRHGPAALLILAALTVRFWSFVSRGAMAIADDSLNQYYPLVTNLFSRLRAADVPLWSPELLLGYPALGSVDVHAFSPFSWAFLVLPPAPAVAASFLAAWLCSGLSMYALGLQLGMRRAGAAVAAVLWVTCRPAVFMQIEPMAIATVPFFPLVLLCWDRACRDRRWPWTAAAGGALGLAMLGGHMQHVYWFVALLLGYGLLVTRRSDASPALSIRIGEMAGLLSRLALVGTLALLIAAVNVLPTAALLEDSIRSDLGPIDRVGGSTEPPGYLRTLRLLPRVLLYAPLPDGQRIDYMEYPRAGVLPVLLGLLALGSGRRFDGRLAALALVFLAFAFAETFPPTHRLVQVLPLNRFRYPERIGLVFTLCTVLLAGRGASRLLEEPRVSWKRLASLLLLAAACLGLIVTKAFGYAELPVSEAWTHLADLALVIAAATLSGASPPLRALRHAFVLAALAVFVLHARRMTDDLTGGEEYYATQDGLRERADGSGESWPPDWLAALPTRDAVGPTRWLCLACPAMRWDSLGLLTGRETPQGYASLRPARVERLVYGRRSIEDDETVQAARRLDLLNVRHVVVGPDVASADPARLLAGTSLRPLSRHGAFHLLENPSYLPRAFFVSHAIAAATEAEAYGLVTAPVFDGRQRVVLEGPAATRLSGGSTEPLYLPATVTRYEGEQVELEVEAPASGWIVLLDRDAPGWSCEVNGRPVPILRANYLFRAVRVSAGLQRVRFRYRNERLLAGSALTLLGIVLVISLSAGAALRRTAAGSR